MPFLVRQVDFSFLLDLAHVLTCRARAKDAELLLLRQQLRLFERQATQPPRRWRWEKGPLAAIPARLPDLARVCRSSTVVTLALTPADALATVPAQALSRLSREAGGPSDGGCPGRRRWCPQRRGATPEMVVRMVVRRRASGVACDERTADSQPRRRKTVPRLR